MQGEEMADKDLRTQVLQFKMSDFHANCCDAECIIKFRSRICFCQTQREILCAP